MHLYEILIVEDNLSFAIGLEMHLSNWGFEKVKIVDNSTEALENIQSQPPDLILMDINIKGQLNGLEVAKEINDLEIPIIYMTGQKDEEYYEEAKSTNVISYLIKPFDEITLKGAIEFYLLKQKNRDNEEVKFFFVRKKNSLSKINISDIDWIKSDANYCDIFCDKNRSTIKKSLKNILEELPEKEFLQIHRQYIVRVNKVEEILLSKNEVKIAGQALPIGRSYKKEFMKRMRVL